MPLGPVRGLSNWYLCCICVCLVFLGHVTSGLKYYEDVSPNIFSFHPKGVRVSLKGHPTLTEVCFHANINQPIETWQPGDIDLDLQFDGTEWVAETAHVVLDEGDVVNYWMHVKAGDKGELLEGRSYIPHSSENRRGQSGSGGIRIAVRQLSPTPVSGGQDGGQTSGPDSKTGDAATALIGSVLNTFFPHRHQNDQYQTTSPTKFFNGQLIQSPTPQYIDQSQTSFVNPAQTNFNNPTQNTYVNPSQTGFTAQTGFNNPSQTGLYNPSTSFNQPQTSLINPLQTGLTNPSQTGYNAPQPVLTNPSQIGLSNPSLNGFNNKPQPVFNNPSQTGLTNPSQTGFNNQPQTSLINPAQTGFNNQPQPVIINPSQTGFANPSQTGFTNPSQTGFTNPSQIGLTNPSITNPSQIGLTNPSQSGFNTQVPVIIQSVTTKPPTPVYIQQPSPILSNTPGTDFPSQFQQAPTITYPTCVESATTVNGQPTCKEQRIFYDSFDIYNSTIWSYDMEFSSLPDSEFCVFTGVLDNSRAGDGSLRISPTLTDDKYGKGFILSGRLDLPDCTSPQADRCTQEGEFAYILPPTMSARYSTSGKWSFKYGRVDIVAKLPRGDWLYPELWLVPRDRNPRAEIRKRLDIAMVRGNTRLQGKRGEEIGATLLEVGAINPKPSNKRDYYRKDFKFKEPNNRLWTDDFHTYSLLWTKDAIAFSVDGIEIGVMDRKSHISASVFNHEMSLVIGLGVGGVRVFPDTHEKPWTNTEPKAMYKFWGAKDNWYRTWSKDGSIMIVKEVRITSL